MRAEPREPPCTLHPGSLAPTLPVSEVPRWSVLEAAGWPWSRAARAGERRRTEWDRSQVLAPPHPSGTSGQQRGEPAVSSMTGSRPGSCARQTLGLHPLHLPEPLPQGGVCWDGGTCSEPRLGAGPTAPGLSVPDRLEIRWPHRPHPFLGRGEATQSRRRPGFSAAAQEEGPRAGHRTWRAGGRGPEGAGRMVRRGQRSHVCEAKPPARPAGPHFAQMPFKGRPGPAHPARCCRCVPPP